MTILQIITRLIAGGAQANTVLMSRELVRMGHRVVLAFGPIYGPEGSLRKEAAEAGAELVELSAMRRAVLPPHDVWCVHQIKRLIARVAPDVVHTHSSKAGILGRAAAWAMRVPVVVHTCHGLPFHDRQPALVRHAYIQAERWAARRCHHIVGVSQAMCDAFVREGIAPASRMSVIPNGLVLDMFATARPRRDAVRRSLGIAPGAPVVGMVARLDPLKGHDDLLDTMPTLLAAHPDTRVLLVGDGWHRAALERRLAREPWGGRVILTGLVEAAQVPGLLAAMDVMALPSRQEGQGRTLAEALLCGCAIVGYDAGGIGEWCVDGETGRLVPVGDRAALGGAIVRLLGDAAERDRLTRQGAALVRDRLDHRLTAAQWDGLYRALREAASLRR